MLIQQQHPGFAPATAPEQEGQPLRTVIGDIVRRFLRATKPPARAGAGVGAVVASRVLRVALWVNLQVAAVLGIVLLYAASTLGVALHWARHAVPLALLALFFVMVKAVFRILLFPFQHLALTVVAAAAVIEGLLIGRLFVQLAYDPEVTGLAGTVLSLTDPLVSPFRELEGTAILHDTGVVEFATLTAMEAYLVASIATVLVLLFWSEFLHMYRRVAMYFSERAERRESMLRREDAEPELVTTAPVAPAPAPATAERSASRADLGAAS